MWDKLERLGETVPSHLYPVGTVIGYDREEHLYYYDPNLQTLDDHWVRSSNTSEELLEKWIPIRRI